MRKIALLLALFVIFLAGCQGGGPNPQNTGAEEAETTSSPSEPKGLEEVPKRVVALTSSIGEIWILAGGELAGITSDASESRIGGMAQDIPVVGTVKDPSVESIMELEPDLVLLSQDITSHGDIREILREAGINCYTAKVETLEDYLTVLKDFTGMTGDEESYRRNGEEVKARVESLLSELPESESQFTALFLRAYSSGIKVKAYDHTVCYILEDIRVTNIAASEGFPLEDLSLEAILQADPDYIFIVPMGDEDAAMENVRKSLEENPAWQQLSAVQNGRLVILSKELYHYKPNDRWGEAYEGLLEIIYPEWYPEK